MQKARGHPGKPRLPPLVGTWFQVLFHSPSGVLFTFPSRYWSTIGRWVVFSLTGWSPQIPTEFHVYRRTQEPSGRPPVFAYGAFTLYRCLFQGILLTGDFMTPWHHCSDAGMVLQPRMSLACKQSHSSGLGCSRFARRYSGNRGFFPFLRVLRCFTSPAYLPCPMCSGRDTRALPRVGSPIRKSPGQRLFGT